MRIHYYSWGSDSSNPFKAININKPTETPTLVFDFMAIGIDLNSEFYATTYDPCDDTYYITSRQDASITNFYEIFLQTGTLQSENFDFYLMGIEVKTNRIFLWMFEQ